MQKRGIDMKKKDMMEGQNHKKALWFADYFPACGRNADGDDGEYICGAEYGSDPE